MGLWQLHPCYEDLHWHSWSEQYNHLVSSWCILWSRHGKLFPGQGIHRDHALRADTLLHVFLARWPSWSPQSLYQGIDRVALRAPLLIGIDEQDLSIPTKSKKRRSLLRLELLRLKLWPHLSTCTQVVLEPETFHLLSIWASAGHMCEKPKDIKARITFPVGIRANFP